MTTYVSRKHREADIVVCAFGWRVRIYAGHSHFDRPRIHRWHDAAHSGVVLRLRRGVRKQPVWGAQWRPL